MRQLAEIIDKLNVFFILPFHCGTVFVADSEGHQVNPVTLAVVDAVADMATKIGFSVGDVDDNLFGCVGRHEMGRRDDGLTGCGEAVGGNG